jgi:hypothetical protein
MASFPNLGGGLRLWPVRRAGFLVRLDLPRGIPKQSLEQAFPGSLPLEGPSWAAYQASQNNRSEGS